MTLALADYEDETAVLCDWCIPRSHFLESWGDARAFDGTASIVQPTIRPLHSSYSDIELLANLLEAGSGYEAVRQTWAETLGADEEDQRWRETLADGIVADSAARTLPVSLRICPELTYLVSGTAQAVRCRETGGLAPFRYLRIAEVIIAEVISGRFPSVNSMSAATSNVPSREETFEWIVRPDPTLWDGRFANNGWLQELPKPLTHVVWDNPAWIAPADAERLQLSNGDVIAVESTEDGTRSLELPVWIVPGHATGCLTLFRGFGKRVFGRVGANAGFSVRNLIQASDRSIGTATIRKTGSHVKIVTTQHHQFNGGTTFGAFGNAR